MNQRSNRQKLVFIFAVLLAKVLAQNDSNPTYACHDYPGALYHCSSSCYPNCNQKFESYYNVMMILPNKAECYLDKEVYGSFRVFLPTSSIATAEADNFYLFNGSCTRNETSLPT